MISAQPKAKKQPGNQDKKVNVNSKSCSKNLARWMQILQESCKVDANLARILQEKWKNYAFPCKILVRFQIFPSLGYLLPISFEQLKSSIEV